ncbi:hypothetical protein ACIPWL_21945 [Streptomyces sp. NPDC090023]
MRELDIASAAEISPLLDRLTGREHALPPHPTLEAALRALGGDRAH